MEQKVGQGIINQYHECLASLDLGEDTTQSPKRTKRAKLDNCSLINEWNNYRRQLDDKISEKFCQLLELEDCECYLSLEPDQNTILGTQLYICAEFLKITHVYKNHLSRNRPNFNKQVNKPYSIHILFGLPQKHIDLCWKIHQLYEHLNQCIFNKPDSSVIDNINRLTQLVDQL